MRRALSAFLILLISLILSSNAVSGEAVWIDVRTADEYGKSQVSEAINIPYNEIAGRISEVSENKDALIYVYCRSGRRSGIAKGTLEEAGFTRVVNLGGLQDAQVKATELYSK